MVSTNNYSRIANNELPINPPNYDQGTSNLVNIDFEDPNFENVNRSFYLKLHNFGLNVQENLKNKVVNPSVALLNYLSEKLDLYLNKVGNPMILKRFIYIMFMATVMFSILNSDDLPQNHFRGSRGTFSDHEFLLKYTKNAISLSKIENDLEYLSSMPHMSGTQGDVAMKNYILSSFKNNGLKVLKEHMYGIYSNYPKSQSLSVYIKGDKNNKIDIELTDSNFNPFSISGSLTNLPLIYGHKGTNDDFKLLKENNLLAQDYVILLKYDKVVSEQVLLAQKFGAKGILFISSGTNENDKLLQQRSVAIQQYWTREPVLSNGRLITDNAAEKKPSKALPSILTAPLSSEDGKMLQSYLSSTGARYPNGNFSGSPNDLLIDLSVEVAVKENQPVSNIIGKFEGREQAEKAIIILASRNSLSNGSQYPNYGTVMLLSLLQLLQEIKFKYKWKPLRSIYLISVGGSEFNQAGATELVIQNYLALKDEIYTVVDISQVGIQNNNTNINIQAHPLLHLFFDDHDLTKFFNLNLSDINEYGDWLPFMALGIPSVVISDPSVQDREFPIESKLDTFETVQKMLHDEKKSQQAVELLQFLLKTIMKLTDDPLMPMDITGYVRHVDKHLKALINVHDNKLNFNGIIKGLILWKRIGTEWNNWKRGWENIVLAHEQGLEPSLLSMNRWTWNKKLSFIGRRQCYSKGLPGRKFYQNVLFGPGIFSDNSLGKNWFMPGVIDAINNDNWKEAQQQVDVVGNVLQKSAKLFIEEANDFGY